eukprot:scaffold57039_cov31-Tisochrysis_lutea.AAC.1
MKQNYNSPSSPGRDASPGAVTWMVDLGQEVRAYNEQTNYQIECAHAEGKDSVVFNVADAGGREKSYRIDFKEMRQIDVLDSRKCRHVYRLDDGVQLTPVTTAKTRHESRVPSTDRPTEGHHGRTLELCHATSQEAARLIQSSEMMKNSPDIYPNGTRSLFGPLIYFAESPEDAEKKALKSGVVLQATVEVGRSVIITGAEAIDGLRYTPDQLRAEGFDSVKGVNMRIGNEWCVARSEQVTRIRVVDYIDMSPDINKLTRQPWWLWPAWVVSLADSVGVNEKAVESTASLSGNNDLKPTAEVNGLRINSAGRPIGDNGQF